MNEREFLREVSWLMLTRPYASLAFLVKRCARRPKEAFFVMRHCARSSLVMNRLIEAGLDVHAKGADGSTILHHLAGEDQIDLRPFLRAGIELECRTNQGFTPLMLAVANPFPGSRFQDRNQYGPWIDSLGVLLEAGADPFARNNRAETLLHIAVEFRNTPAFQQMLDLGVDPTLPDHRGLTPRQTAEACGAHDILKALDRFEAVKTQDQLQNVLPEGHPAPKIRRM